MIPIICFKIKILFSFETRNSLSEQQNEESLKHVKLKIQRNGVRKVSLKSKQQG